MVSYYDIDDILAQEELMQVTSLLDFTYLAHLDPDYVHEHSNPLRAHTLDDENSDHDVGTKTGTKKQSQNYYLKEGTRFKMPIWSIEKWAEVGFAKISVPKHYGRRSRERLDADPVSVDLRNRNERFFMSGLSLIDLVQRCIHTLSKGNKKNSTRQGQGREQSSSSATALTGLNELRKEAMDLKRTLLQTYTGARLRRTFDWTLSNIEDDVSSYTQKLTEMEQRLFARGAAASRAQKVWKLHGSRRICVSEAALRSSVMAGRERVRACRTDSAKASIRSSVGSKRSIREGLGPQKNGRLKKARAF